MLVSYQEAADLLGVLPSDSLLVRLVNAADAWAQRACDREFERRVRTEIVRSHCRDFVILRESPVIAVTSVQIDQSGRFQSGTYTTIDSTQIAFNSSTFADDSRIFYTLGRFPDGERAVKVTYEAGWWPAEPSADFLETSLNQTAAAAQTPRAPEDIRDALLSLVATNYKRGSDERMQSERQGDRSWTRFADGIDPQITQTVNRYRRFRF